MKTTQNVSFAYNRMTVISGRPLSCTGTMPLCKDTGRYCETILNVVFQRRLSEVMKTLKFNDCGSTYSVKIESVPQPLTFTLIWCEYSAQRANSTYNKSSGRGEKKETECTPLIVSEAVWVGGPSVIHKPNCLKEIIREITRVTGVYTHQWNFLMWRCKDVFIGLCQTNCQFHPAA